MTQYFRRRSASLTESLAAGIAAAAIAGVAYYLLRTVLAKESIDARPSVATEAPTPESHSPSNSKLPAGSSRDRERAALPKER